MKQILLTTLLTIGLLEAGAQEKPATKAAEGKTTGEQTAAVKRPAPKLVETISPKGKEMVIPYKKYVLSNGLQVVVHEDHSDPVVYVDVTYHVGSAREQEGRSGFAHFFEHMMFQGSKNVADEQHFKIITEAGGTLNGTTNTDRTNYFETVPSNQLEKMLWLESDRMGFLLDSVTQPKFEVQRATVKNERGQRYDNAPYGVAGEKTGEALYPQAHPYSWTTIGYIEDLNRVDVNDLKRFYMRWYGPNNAVLTVAGDVDTKQVVELADKYFGSIPRGPEVKPMQVADVKLNEDRYISYEDNIRFPMLKLSWPSARLNTNDDAALDVLGEILGGSESSPLYQAFVKTQKAVSASSYEYSRELAGQFEISMRLNAGTMLAETQKELMATLAEWEKKGATDDDLIRFKATYESGLYDRLSTVQGKGIQLANYQTLAGDANYLKKEMARYMAVTKEDVMRVYNTYIKNKPAVILSVVPKGKGDLKAHADTWTMYKRHIQEESSEYKNLSYATPTDNFNRAAMPAAKAAGFVAVPEFWTEKLDNGAKVIGIQSKETPKVNIQLSLALGHRYESRDKAGMADILSSMLNESTQKHSTEELTDMLQRLGSSVRFSTNDNELVMSITTLKKNLDATLAIAKEKLYQPKFDEADFERIKKEQIDGINDGATRPVVIANNVYTKLLYGNDNVMGLPINGTLETVQNVSLQDVKNFYDQISGQTAIIAISGDISRGEIFPKLDLFKALKNTPAKELKEAAVPNIDKTRIYFIDKKGAPQSEIRMGYVALPYDATGDYFLNTIMNYAYAGAFNSRINYLLREVRGFTYGARGGFAGSKFAGPYTLGAGVRANTTDSSLVDIFSETKKYVDNGISEEELTFTRNAMAQADALKYESPFQKLVFVKRLVEYNLDPEYVRKQATILNTVTKAQVDAAAKKYLPYNNMIIVVVGDKATNLEKVKKLGYEVVELDLSGNPVKP